MKIDTYNHQNGNNFGTLQYAAIGMENKMFLKRMEGLDESHRPKTCGNAGVSPATVSRYLNASESVSLALADQIDKALITLGGTPAVRQSQKRMVLVLLTHLRFDFYSQTLAELLSQEPEGNWALALLRYDPCTRNWFIIS